MGIAKADPAHIVGGGPASSDVSCACLFVNQPNFFPYASGALAMDRLDVLSSTEAEPSSMAAFLRSILGLARPQEQPGL